MRALLCRYTSTSKQETCLCKACENFTQYDKCFNEVIETVTKAMLHGCEDESQLPPDEQDPVLSNAAFEALQELAQIKRRIDKVRILSHSCLYSHTAACTHQHSPGLPCTHRHYLALTSTILHSSATTLHYLALISTILHS